MLSRVDTVGRPTPSNGHRLTDPASCLVCCPYCVQQFELFAASWCEHQAGEASKVCLSCRRCLCDHPAYTEPHFWKDAPAAFQRQGFRRLFLFYL